MTPTPPPKRFALVALIASGVALLGWLWLRRPRRVPPPAPQHPTPADSAPPTPSPPAQATAGQWAMFISALALLLVGLPLLDYDIRWPTFVVISLCAVLIGLVYGYGAQLQRARLWLWRAWRAERRANPLTAAVYALPSLRRWQIALEWGVIALAVAWVAADYLRYDPSTQLFGLEAEWLTSNVYLAHDSLRQWGTIPRWQPYVGVGEPLVDNPFAFIFNPLSSAPALLFGGAQGIKYSVALYALFAGVGGWFLGYMLGLGGTARVLLGLLMVGKGNMHATILSGYFQLGVSQAYFPWIIGGALGVLRGRARWAVALMGAMVALQFLAGNIWYTLPTLFSVFLLALTHSVALRRGEWVNLAGWRRLAIAGLFALGLCAVAFLPIWANRDYIGDHTPERRAGAVIPPERAVQLFFRDDLAFIYQLQVQESNGRIVRGEPHFYYSFVLPPWFALLLFVLLPPIYPTLHRPALGRMGRIWSVGVVMIIVTTLWGMGGSDLFLRLYEAFPLLRQWRFVGRALAVASFWLAVLVALRWDGLWRALDAAQSRPLIGDWPRMARWLRTAAQAFLLLLGALAAYQVNSAWFSRHRVETVHQDAAQCLAWLREQYPDQQLTVERIGYDRIAAFIANRIRITPIEADYEPLAQSWTLGNLTLRQEKDWLRFAMPTKSAERQFLLRRGYRPLLDAPQFFNQHCLWHNPAKEVPYAYTISIYDLGRIFDLDTLYDTVIAVETVLHTSDWIGLVAPPRAQITALIISETAYPGWSVWVDGQPRDVESVGGLLGVLLPASEQPQIVTFEYRPPLYTLGAAITIFSAFVVSGYLLGIGKRL